ncbi:MAG: leucine-rich repeat protein, partial [Acutalibacteraceae bacterium]|nr:leucine-rich repeat protein [Acutalibacteraceae bacterium]
MKKTFIKLLSAVLLVVILLSPTVLSGLRKTNMPITESFSTKATAASYLSVDEAARYASMFYEAGSSSYELACLALTGQQQGSPETWASIAEGISLFAGISNEVNWDNLLCDASDITTSNITHITGAISGMFDIMDSIDKINESESALRTSYEGLKIVKGLFDVFGKGSCFPSTLSLIMVSVDATLCVAGFLAQANFQESLTLYEAELLIEYSTGLPLTYQTITKPNPGSSLSVEETQHAFDVIYFKYLSKRMIDSIGGSSSGGGNTEVPVEDVGLAVYSYTLFNNETLANPATVYPSNATNKSVTYSSSDTSIATVSSKGIITPVSGGYGNVTIYATAYNGVKDSCTITILPFKASKIGNGYKINSYIGSDNIVEIPQKVNGTPILHIGSYAFVTGITTVTIPYSVTSIDEYAFQCDDLENIIVDKSNLVYCSDEYGVLFNKDKTELIQYPRGNKRTSYTIPDSVTSISEGAFEYCTSLTSITIPDSVTSIGGSAFKGCASITSITIPEGVKTIGERAFEWCENLETLTIPKSIVNIGDSIVGACDNITTIYYTGTYLQWDFVDVGRWNDDIMRIIILDCNSEKPYYLPGSCGDNLTYVLYTDGDLIISGTGTMINYEYPFDIPWWERRSLITRVILEKGITNIGDWAFHNCYNLTYVSIPDGVTNIGNESFSLCDNLTSVTIPDSVKELGLSAFYGCSSLELVEISNSVISIGEYAFSDCDNLTIWCYTGSYADSYATANGIDVEYIALDIEKDILILKLSEPSSLTASLNTPYAENTGVVWSSTNTSIATVDGNGVVKGIKAGTTVIVATSKDGGLRDYCVVKVVGIEALSTLNIDFEIGIISGLSS